MKKTLAVIGRIIIIILVSALIGYDIYLFNATYVCNDKLPMPMGRGTAVIMSGSMEPELSVYDVVIVKKDTNFQVGDIVTYVENGSLVTHRIVNVKGDVVVTKGDANNTEDPAILKGDILGKVVKKVPGLGRVLLFLQKPIGFLCILLMLLGGMELSFRRNKKARQKKIDLVKAEIEELKNEVKQISINDIKKKDLGKAEEDVLIRVNDRIKKPWMPEKIAESQNDDEKEIQKEISKIEIEKEQLVGQQIGQLGEQQKEQHTGQLGEQQKDQQTGQLGEQQKDQQTGQLGEQQKDQQTGKLGEQQKDQQIGQSGEQQKDQQKEQQNVQQVQFAQRGKEKQTKTDKSNHTGKKSRFHFLVFGSVREILIVLLLLVIISLNIVSLTMQKSGKPFTLFGYYMVMIESDSMEPAIKENDLVFLKQSKEYKVGEVITYGENGDFITHRVVLKTQDGYMTKGDANQSVDQTYVTRDSIIGKVVKVNGFVGFMIKLFLNPVLFSLMIGGLIVSAIYKKITDASKTNKDGANIKNFI